MNRGLGYIPEQKSKTIKFSAPKVSPDITYLEMPDVPVLNQGGTNSCVGHAIASALRMQYILERNRDVALSPYFIYHEARRIHQDEITDDGTMTSAAMTAIKKNGICPYEDWESEPNKINDRPSLNAYRMAYDFAGAENHYDVPGRSKNTVQEVENALLLGRATWGGFEISRSFLNNKQPEVFRVTDHDTFAGYHAMVFKMVDAKLGIFAILNSWGKDYAKNGIITVEYEWVQRYLISGHVQDLKN